MAFQLPSDIMDTCTGALYCYAKWAYDVTNGLFWVMVLLGFVIILLMATMRFGSRRAFGFASIVGLFASIWLATMQLMAWKFASAFILAGAGGIVAMLMQEK